MHLSSHPISSDNIFIFIIVGSGSSSINSINPTISSSDIFIITSSSSKRFLIIIINSNNSIFVSIIENIL